MLSIDEINSLEAENEKLKAKLMEIALCVEELEQQYYDLKDFSEIKEIKRLAQLEHE